MLKQIIPYFYLNVHDSAPITNRPAVCTEIDFFGFYIRIYLHMESLLVENISLAEVMAHAEHPYRELAAIAMSTDTEHSLHGIKQQGDRAAISAGRTYVQGLDLLLDQYEKITPPKYIGYDDFQAFAEESGASKIAATKALRALQWAGSRKDLVELENPDKWMASKISLDGLLNVFPSILEQVLSKDSTTISTLRLYKVFGDGVGPTTFNFIQQLVAKYTAEEQN